MKEMDQPRKGRSQLDLKTYFLAQACHWGMILSLILVILVYLPYYFVNWSSDDSTMFGTTRWGSNQSEYAESGSDESLVQYRMEWESPDVREVSQDERNAEESFGEAPRRFIPLGTGSFLFVLLGAYRTGPNSFGVTGLGNLQLYESASPGFECSWIGAPSEVENFSSELTVSDVEVIHREVINGTATKYTEDDLIFGGRYIQYISVVVHCTFEAPVGTDGRGGQLMMIANHGEALPEKGLRSAEFVAMVERPGVYNESLFDAPFKYKYLYCGSPLHDRISPSRVREWIAYHMRLFGQNSHFIFYDVGGLDNEVWRVVEPWVKLGRVSIMNAKQEARYRAYLNNQFLLANDCMLRAKTLAKWTFFFDFDEYIHVTEGAHLESSFHDVMSEMDARGERAITVQIEQIPMSSEHCVRDDSNLTSHERQWAIEKLLYRRQVNRTDRWVYWDHWQDSKSAHQAKYLLAVGVHTALHVQTPDGMNVYDVRTTMDSEACRNNCFPEKLNYYHYRGTTPRVPEEEVCKELVDPLNTTIDFDGAIYEFDDKMASMTNIVRDFEHSTIGP